MGLSLIHGTGLGLVQAADADSATVQIHLGEQIYGQYCAICHYDGAGNTAAPDLVGSSFWQDGPRRTITLILKGQSRVSVVDGKPFNGEMPAMDYLTDEEIAAVTAYVFTQFAERKEGVEPETVAELRTALPKEGGKRVD